MKSAILPPNLLSRAPDASQTTFLASSVATAIPLCPSQTKNTFSKPLENWLSKNLITHGIGALFFVLGMIVMLNYLHN